MRGLSAVPRMKPSGPLPWRLWIALLWARVPIEDGTIRKGYLGWEPLCDDREFRLSIWGALRGPSMGVVKNGVMAGIPCHHPVFDNVLGLMPAIYCHHPVLNNTWGLQTAITRFFATRGRTGLSSPELTQPARVRGRHHLAQTRWPKTALSQVKAGKGTASLPTFHGVGPGRTTGPSRCARAGDQSGFCWVCVLHP